MRAPIVTLLVLASGVAAVVAWRIAMTWELEPVWTGVVIFLLAAAMMSGVFVLATIVAENQEKRRS